MARLIDRMLRDKSLDATHRAFLEDAVVIVADNVAEYFYYGTDQKQWSLADDFPILAPPLELMFLDFRKPKQWGHDLIAAWGVLCHGVYTTKELAHQVAPALQCSVGELQGSRWILSCTLFVESGQHQPYIETLTYFVPICHDGSVLRGSNGKPIGVAIPMPWLQRLGKEACVEFAHSHFQLFCCAWLTIAFMHCKNVVQRVERPPEWARKAAQKKHKRPLVSYRVLEIEPMRHVLRAEGKSEEVGLKRALHICRGHFATYAEKPLFGRVRGTFWRPAHVRGHLSEGVALKDYAVKSPRALRPEA